MAVKYFVADAFADTLFSGNPAGVCLLDDWIDDQLMQSVAAENNLAETAFVVRRGECYELRWFTPVVEIDLCGHATLASAFVVSEYVDKQAAKIEFHTKSGVLPVAREGDLFVMDLPARKPVETDITPIMKKAAGTEICGAYISRDLMLLLDSGQAVRNLKPDLDALKSIPDAFGLIVTAEGRTAILYPDFSPPMQVSPRIP